MFPSYFIDELKSRIKLSEVIGSKVKLTKKGREYIGLCPFHNEKTPSFTVNEDKGFYHCFGCGAHGNIITFEMEANGLSFLEAIEKLAAKAGLEVPKLDNKTVAEQKIITNIYEVTELAAKVFEENLHKETSSFALNYLKKRGLTDNIIKEFRIGFAPNNNELEHYLTGKGVPKELIIAAGLIKDGSNYAYFRDRIIFPIIDRQKRVIAFGGRVLNNNNQPKYLNSPETLIFDKSRTLYGINSASDKIHQTGQIIVCEGYMDVIGLHQYGFKNAVATLGTALTEENIRHLWQYADEPILCFDGDFAGQKALSRAALRALPILSPKKSLKFAIMPTNLDPDELVKEKGSKAFEDVLASSLELFDIIWNILTENKSFKSPEQKAGLEQDIENFVNQINNVSIKNHYRRALKNKFYQTFVGTKKSSMNKNIIKPNKLLPSDDLDFKTMLNYLINFPQLGLIFKEEIISIESTNKNLNKILNSIYEIIINNENSSLDIINQELSKIDASVLKDESEIFANKKLRIKNDEELKNEFQTLLLRFEEKAIIKQINELHKIILDSSSQDFEIINKYNALKLQREKIIFAINQIENI